MINRLPPEPPHVPPIDSSFKVMFQNYLEHAYCGDVDKLPDHMVGQLRATFMAGCLMALGRTLHAITDNPSPQGAEKAIKAMRHELEAYSKQVEKGGL